MIRAIFFDLDGSIVDCADLHYEALNRALKESDFPTIGRTEHDTTFNGLSTRAKLTLLQTEYRSVISGQDAIERVFVLKQRYTAELAKEHVRPDQVKVEMFRGLAKGYKLAVVSNCIRVSVEMILGLAGLNWYTSFYVSNQDVVRCKPAPDPYLLAVEKMSERIGTLKPTEVLVIEDNEKGVQSAQAAGLEVVQLQYPYITLGVMRAVIAAAERKMAG